MKRSAFLLVFLLAFGLLGGTGLAQTQTGTIIGRVTDQQGGVLPGVTMTLVGPRGSLTVVTDAEGSFRFVGVQPASYTLKAELQGFAAQEKTEVGVSMAKTLTVDFALKVSGLSETVEVVGTASTVDVKSASTTTSVSNELLSAMPIYSSTSTGLMNSAPGVNNSSAYGGQGSYGNALLMDGVDTRDPEGGSAWTFFNQNLVEEVQIGGLGAPAEYGGFTGGIVNTITKSGGNMYSGLFSLRYTSDSLAGKNITDALLTQNPSLGGGDVTKKLVDTTVQMGGPIKKDKAFFFGSVQRYSANVDPSGPLSKRQEISPRFNAKITLQPTSSDTIVVGVQYDSYNVDGRVGWWPAAQATYSATVKEDAPEWVYNAQYRKVIGSSALLEAKFTGYTGYYYLDPIDPAPPIYEGSDGSYSGGGGGTYRADRSRNQFQASLTKYAEKFGHHSFKFGAEIERSHVRSQYQPYGPAGFYIYQYYGAPLYQVSYSYDFQGNNRRVSGYAQDQWSAGRLTMNLGLRLDHITGYSPVLKKTVYTPDNAWGPRLGAAFDVTGKGTTVIKGFWGRYFEGAASLFYTSATPGQADRLIRYYNDDGSLTSPEVDSPGIVYGISSKIKHPRTDDANVAFEQQITKDFRFTATGIYRKTGNFVNNVINGATYSPFAFTNPLTGQAMTLYTWANRSTTEESYYIRNQDGYQYVTPTGQVIATANPKRDYKALMLVLSKSLRNRWGFQASYVLSKATGNVSNSSGGAYLGNGTWDSPNTAIINAQGELGNSQRHEVKVYGSWQVPVAEVMLSLIFTGTSGTPYQPYYQFGASTLNFPLQSRRQVFLAPRGSYRNDFYKDVDIRAEKYFKFQGHRFGVYADITNLLNSTIVTTRQTRYPNTSIGGNTVLFNAPTAIMPARQATLGARWTF
jgi:hypothetical protein